MHQVENVLRISKLEKKSWYRKRVSNVEEVIIDAIEHVNLILEDREGQIITHFEATRTTVLMSDKMLHVLENAIKYSRRS
jgi:two-component system phosphate regulon sensor histidine kinase PhoR